MTKSPSTHIRATVQAPGNSGDPFTVLVDGADSTITVNGKPGYAPVAGDRVMVTRLGTQMQMVGMLAGTEILTAAVFQTTTGLPLGGVTPGTGAAGIILGEAPGGAEVDFFAGIVNEEPGHINCGVSGGSPFLQLSTGTKAAQFPASIFMQPGGGHGTIELQGGVSVDFTLDVTGAFEAHGNAQFDGNLAIQPAGALFNNDTTTSTNAANLVLTGANRIVAHSSLAKNKLDIKPLDSAKAHEVLRLEPSTWRDRYEHERDREEGDTRGLRNTWGFVVDQVKQVAPDFISSHGPDEDVDTQAVIAALLKVVVEQEARLTALESR